MSEHLLRLLLRARSSDEAVLDELVHETAQELGLGELNEIADPAEQDDHLAAIEVQASQINNDGFERQIEYLLGAGVSKEAIEEVVHGRHTGQSQGK